MNQDALDEKGIRDITELVRFTPGVAIDTSGTNQISIRGISSSAGAGTTGIYIDDTPIQMRELGFNPDETLPKAFDLDRVEVLRGPQGTLFGSGSEGGTHRGLLHRIWRAERRGWHRTWRPDHRWRARLPGERLVPLRRRMDQPRRQHRKPHRE
jgi:outer membrane receptor for ferrienterochelin and colicin